MSEAFYKLDHSPDPLGFTIGLWAYVNKLIE